MNVESARREPARQIYLDSLRQRIKEKYNYSAPHRQKQVDRHRYYYNHIKKILQFLVEPNRRVLQIRSDTGGLLAAVNPCYGVGLDISENLASLAKEKYPKYDFRVWVPEKIDLDEKFDYILLINAAGDIVDVERLFNELQKVSTPQTRVIIINYNYLWEPVMRTVQFLRLKSSQLPQNWLSTADINNLLYLSNFESVRMYKSLLLPVYIPLISTLFNKFLGHLPVLEYFDFIQTVVARPKPVTGRKEGFSVSVVLPCRNEKGNIEEAVKRMPAMGSHTEIIFVDDKSTDGTGDEVRRVIRNYPDYDIKCLEGPGIAKAEAVWAGFRAASGDILMILDGDLSVMPEELPFFYKALVEGKGEFINGSRLVYPQQKEAMRFLNIYGNKMFSVVFSYLLGQRVKDTLCGTKVLWRKDFDKIKPFIGTWGLRDKWGDYDLMFGAARLGLRIVDCPVHYCMRTYGQTKMTRRFSHAWHMLKMCICAAGKLRFL